MRIDPRANNNVGCMANAVSPQESRWVVIVGSKENEIVSHAKVSVLHLLFAFAQAGMMLITISALESPMAGDSNYNLLSSGLSCIWQVLFAAAESPTGVM